MTASVVAGHATLLNGLRTGGTDRRGTGSRIARLLCREHHRTPCRRRHRRGRSETFRASTCATARALWDMIETGKPIVSRAVHIVRSDGRRILVSIPAALLRSGGDLICGVKTLRDLRAQEELSSELPTCYLLADTITNYCMLQCVFSLIPNNAETVSTALIQTAAASGRSSLPRRSGRESPEGQPASPREGRGSPCSAPGVGGFRRQGRRVRGREEGQARVASRRGARCTPGAGVHDLARRRRETPRELGTR